MKPGLSMPACGAATPGPRLSLDAAGARCTTAVGSLVDPCSTSVRFPTGASSAARVPRSRSNSPRRRTFPFTRRLKIARQRQMLKRGDAKHSTQPAPATSSLAGVQRGLITQRACRRSANCPYRERRPIPPSGKDRHHEHRPLYGIVAHDLR